MIDTKVPITSALCHPNDRVLLAFLYAIVSDIMDIPNPTKSDAKCAVSVKMAIEFDKIPPVIYTAMKNTDTNDTINSLRMDFLFASLASFFLAKKLMGVLTAIGVPIASGMNDIFAMDFTRFENISNYNYYNN